MNFSKRLTGFSYESPHVEAVAGVFVVGSVTGAAADGRELQRWQAGAPLRRPDSGSLSPGGRTSAGNFDWARSRQR